MKLFSAPLALILLTARFSGVKGQIGCDDAPADLEECILREQDNDGNCMGCDPTVPTTTDCAELEEWYCSISTCCADCENQVADAAECVDDNANLGCVDFEDSLCSGEVDQIGCDDAPADVEECILREQDNDGACVGCDPTVPTTSDCAELQEWYCSLSTCCPDCELQVADAAECVDENANLGCVDFEDSLCTGEVGLEQCSEATAAFTDCVIQNCPPDADILCDLNLVDADTCFQIERSCQFFNSCCNNACGAEVEFILATCGLGVCVDHIDCSAPPTGTSEASGQSEFEGCSEATAAFTQCVAENCPEDADVVCDPNLADGDTCTDVEGACQDFTSCCSGQCGDQIEALLATCAFGACSGIECDADASPTTGPPTTGPPTTGPPTTAPPGTSGAACSLSMLALVASSFMVLALI